MSLLSQVRGHLVNFVRRKKAPDIPLVAFAGQGLTESNGEPDTAFGSFFSHVLQSRSISARTSLDKDVLTKLGRDRLQIESLYKWPTVQVDLDAHGKKHKASVFGLGSAENLRDREVGSIGKLTEAFLMLRGVEPEGESLVNPEVHPLNPSGMLFLSKGRNVNNSPLSIGLEVLPSKNNIMASVKGCRKLPLGALWRTKAHCGIPTSWHFMRRTEVSISNVIESDFVMSRGGLDGSFVTNVLSGVLSIDHQRQKPTDKWSENGHTLSSSQLAFQGKQKGAIRWSTELKSQSDVPLVEPLKNPTCELGTLSCPGGGRVDVTSNLALSRTRHQYADHPEAVQSCYKVGCSLLGKIISPVEGRFGWRVDRASMEPSCMVGDTHSSHNGDPSRVKGAVALLEGDFTVSKPVSHNLFPNVVQPNRWFQRLYCQVALATPGTVENSTLPSIPTVVDSQADRSTGSLASLHYRAGLTKDFLRIGAHSIMAASNCNVSTKYIGKLGASVAVDLGPAEVAVGYEVEWDGTKNWMMGVNVI